MNIINRIKKYPEEVALIIILIIAAVLRFHHLGTSSLANDELSALWRLRFDNFSDSIQLGLKTDTHPAGIHTLLYFIVKYFGDGVFTIRFLFAVAGVVSVYLIYILGKKWFGKNTGLLAAAALAILKLPLMHGQIARPYSFGLMCCLAAVYLWTCILFSDSEKENRKKIIFYHAFFIICMSACMYIHYFSFMFAGIIGFSGLFFLLSKTWRGYLISGVIILLLYIPEISVFKIQLAMGGIGDWLSKPDSRFFPYYIAACLNNSLLIKILFSAVLLLSVFLIRKNIRLNKYHSLCISWFLLPFIIGYYYSVKFSAVLQVSCMLFSYPFFLLFMFSFVKDKIISRRIFFTLLFAVCSASLYSTVIEKKYYRQNQFGVFKEIAEDVVKWDKKYGEENITKVLSTINPFYINYYFSKMHHPVQAALYHMDTEENIARLQNLVDTCSTQYFIYAWTNIGHSYTPLHSVMEKFPVVVARDSFLNSEITLLKRDEIFRWKNPEKTMSADFENADSSYLKNRTDETFYSGKYSYRFNSETEYGHLLSLPLAEIKNIDDKTLTASVWFNSADTAFNALLVVSFEADGNTYNWSGVPLGYHNFTPGKWQKVLASIPIQELKGKNDVVKIYVWSRGKTVFYIDDLELKVEDIRLHEGP